MVDRKHKIKFIFKLVGAITGACVGISAGAAFKVGLKNIDASIFGYISGKICLFIYNYSQINIQNLSLLMEQIIYSNLT